VNYRNDAAGSLDLVEVLRVSLPSLGPISVGLCALHWSGSVFFWGVPCWLLRLHHPCRSIQPILIPNLLPLSVR